MLYPQTNQVFEDFKSNNELDFFKLRCVSNGTDCILNGIIPRSFISDIRSNFSLHIDEEIMMFRDTSFWDEKNQGTVVTDWGVTIVPDNDTPSDIIQIAWADVDHVENNGDQLLFFMSEDRTDNIPIHLNFFIKNSDNYTRTDGILATLFTSMAQSQLKASLDEIFEATMLEYRELMKGGKDDEALQVLLQFREEYDNVAATEYICSHLQQKEDWARCLKILDEDINAMSDEQLRYKSFLTWLKINILKAQEAARLSVTDKSGKSLKEAQKNNFDYILANNREACLFVAQNAPDDLIYNAPDGEINISDDSNDKFYAADRYLGEHFLEKPYKDRKLIVPVSEYTSLGQRTLTAININLLNSINFPMGHPIANQLYVGHPLVASRYIPFESYELELIEDRVREFSMLSQALGATSITIECINANDHKETGSEHTEANANADYLLASGNAAYKGDANRKFISEISKKINLHQEFSPKEPPHIPEGLLWYDNEPSWQRLAAQRMKESLNVHVERIESRTSQVVENSELKKVSAEVETLFVAANGSWENSMNQMFETHENAIIAIRVEFAPFESLMKSSSSQPKSDTNLKQNEQDYIEELRECLANDGEISAGERRLLNRLRVRLGISESRAQELEKSLSKPKLLLTPVEQDYLDEFKEILSEGEISPRSRRLLDKLRVSMGINEERAREIENSII